MVKIVIHECISKNKSTFIINKKTLPSSVILKSISNLLSSMAMQVVDLVQDFPVIFSTISSTSCVLGKGLGCTTCLGILALGEKFRFLFTTQLIIYFFPPLCWMVVEVVDACCLVKMVDWVTVL